MRNEAIFLKIMIEKLISVYVVPRDLRIEAHRLISVDISKLSDIELSNYVNACLNLISRIESLGKIVNVVNASEVANNLAKVIRERIVNVSKVLRLQVNETLLKELSSCKSIKEMARVLTKMRLKLLPQYAEVLSKELAKEMNVSTARGASIVNISAIHIKL